MSDNFHDQHNVDDEPVYTDAVTEDDLAEEQPVIDAEEIVEDAADEAHDQVDQAASDVNQFGENLAKAASDAAYATIGLVGVVSDRLKEFYSEQKKQYLVDHPDFDGEPEAKHVASRFGEQVDKLVEDIGRTIRDLAERGRASSKVAADDAAQKAAQFADQAASKASDLADKAGDAAQRAADKVGTAAHSAADDVEAAAEDAAEHVSDAAEDVADQAEQRDDRTQW